MDSETEKLIARLRNRDPSNSFAYYWKVCADAADALSRLSAQDGRTYYEHCGETWRAEGFQPESECAVCGAKVSFAFCLPGEDHDDKARAILRLSAQEWSEEEIVAAVATFQRVYADGKGRYEAMRQVLSTLPRLSAQGGGEKTYTYNEAMRIAERGLQAWRTKPHNDRWWRKIDGTPIPNDLLVNIALAFAAAPPPASPAASVMNSSSRDLSPSASSALETE